MEKTYPEVKTFVIELMLGDVELIRWQEKLETDDEITDYLQRIIDNELFNQLIP